MAISLSQIRKFMQTAAEADRAIRSVEATGETLEEALREASIQLGVPVKNLVYEVLQKGGKTVTGKKLSWQILAYIAKKEIAVDDLFNEDFGIKDITEKDAKDKHRDGKVCVRRQPDGVFMKVTAPLGNGKKATMAMAKDALTKKNILNYDESLIEKIVKRAEGTYVRIAPYDYNPASDPVMCVNITDMEMRAYLVIQPPGIGGSDVRADTIRAFLNNNRVVYGIKEDVLQELEDNPLYNEEILIAEGTKPKNGADAHLVYNFRVDHSTIKFQINKDGRVDFKDLNLIENVVAGQQLAKKIPPEAGQPGYTVTGKVLPAKSGKDIQIQLGKNTKLSEDGMQIISEINGQVILLNNKINVEPVYTVNGDVNLHTGNILFLGTVVIRGNIEDGFTVKAAGNIEVHGNVGKAILDAEGDIIVHQGILAKGEGKVKAGRNVYAKFIEHGNIVAEDSVFVTDGILHSFVDANKSIICQGRRASIVGGRLRAGEEINAKNLGSVAGAETILEVGYDPKSKERLNQQLQQFDLLTKELEELNRNLTTLENVRKVQKKLSDEKQKYYDELTEKKIKAETELENVKKEIEEIKNYLNSLKLRGKISASERVFPGVKIYLKDVMDRIRVEQKAVTYVLEGKRIRMKKYEQPETEIPRRR